jgi:predicted nucleotide-binding protein
MIERFTGDNNKRKLIDAIKRQLIVRDDDALALKLCDNDNIELLEVEAGARIITQDDDVDDLFLILVGRVSVQAHGREVAVAKAGEHVGEMAVIDPSARRSASVFALERTVLAKISEPVFSTLAAEFPDLWRQLAVQLGARVRQRNELLPQRNPRSVLFLGSSKEALPVVRAIQDAFQHDDFLVRPWTTPGVFGASRYPLEDLDRQLRISDFAVLVLGPDDLVLSRGSISAAPRDNVVFELGFFMGALTRDRTFMVIPRGAETKIPSDLLGLNPLMYAPGSPDTLAERIGPICNEIRSVITKAGPK